MLPFCIFATWCRQMTRFSILCGWKDKTVKLLILVSDFLVVILNAWYITPAVILKPFSVYSILNFSFFFHFDYAFQQAFHISQQTVREFNHYIIVMVNCLWNSRMFHATNLGVKIDEELLLRSKVPQWGARFSFIHHPAFMSFAIDFHQRVGDRLLCCTHTSLNKSPTFAYYLTVREQWEVCLQWSLVINQGDKCDINVSFIGDTLI